MIYELDLLRFVVDGDGILHSHVPSAIHSVSTTSRQRLNPEGPRIGTQSRREPNLQGNNIEYQEIKRASQHTQFM